MTESFGTVKLDGEEVEALQKLTGEKARGLSITATKAGELNCICTCGKRTTIGRDKLEDALGLREKAPECQNPHLEGVLSDGLMPGDLVFLTDNTNSHNYPLATLLLYESSSRSNHQEAKAMYLLNGFLRIGNNLPLTRLFRPTRIHADLIPDSPLMRKIVEVSGVEVFGETKKKPVTRKSYRSDKNDML